MKWYQMAAKHGDSFAQNNIGGLYSNGQGVKKDHQEAMKWYQMAAKQGHARAQANIGFLYENGHGVKKDHQEAMKWICKAASKHDKTAIDFLKKSDRTCDE